MTREEANTFMGCLMLTGAFLIGTISGSVVTAIFHAITGG